MGYKFIVFEGLDGSGSTTQATMLVDYLITKGEPAQFTTEPSDGPIGNLIRSYFKGRTTFGGDNYVFDMMMANLFAADRYDHIYNDLDGINKKLETSHVISTRYFFSSLVYHCNTKDDFKLIQNMNSTFPIPDLTFYLDISPQESIKRMSNRFVKDKYEKLSKLEKVHLNYKNLFNNCYKENIHKIDGEETVNEVHDKIIRITSSLL